MTGQHGTSGDARVRAARTALLRAAKRLDDAERAGLDAAIDFAAEAHGGVERDSGEPYVTHPLAVAAILAEIGADAVTLCGSVLHDVVEDTHYTSADIAARFGADVARLVEGVTKLSRADGRTREQAAAETIRKMFLAMSDDIRVVLIKLADRLHNMRTISGVADPERRARTGRQTLEIYAPLAERLGLWQWKRELEDRSFAETDPEHYAEVRAAVAKGSRSRDAYVRRSIEALSPRLEAAGIAAPEISGRAKHLYSVWRKMARKGVAFEQIYDAYALRVIVADQSACYAALGAVHALWTPIPGEFDDYIATPKFNGYQSLHTAVIALDGRPLEVQIRTRAMHEASENGAASHFRYKDGSAPEAAYDAKLAWLVRMLDWQRDVSDAAEFVEGVKLDLFAEEVFVFTPAGAVKTLPAGATPLDFAYLVHTEVGHRAIGAKVNGRLVPFTHALSSGDICEILTTRAAGHGPSRDWLAIVRTPHARAKIREWLRRADREANIAAGREVLERDLARLSRTSAAVIGEARLAEVAAGLGHASLDDLYAAIGYGSAGTGTVIGRLGVAADNAAAIPQVTPPTRPVATGAVRVAGATGILTRFAGCCSPIPGDAVRGWISQGRGVIVHTAACPSITGDGVERSRLVDVAWETAGGAAVYPVAIRVECANRPGSLSDIAAAIAAEHVNIRSMSMADVEAGAPGRIDAVIAPSSIRQLTRIFARIEAVRGVASVSRSGAQGA